MSILVNPFYTVYQTIAAFTVIVTFVKHSDDVHWNVWTNIQLLKKSFVIFLRFLKMIKNFLKSFWWYFLLQAEVISYTMVGYFLLLRGEEVKIKIFAIVKTGEI